MMKKRFMSILLILSMALTLLPATALAADKTFFAAPGTVYTGKAPGDANFNDDDVTWLGAEAEYQKTLKAFFDSGLRKVPVGDLAADGSLINVKYGLVDRDGAFAAQPIYDKIEAEYLHNVGSFGELSTTEDDNKSTESIFVDGYVQATRGGKMGLIDSTGKEVIPCQYDGVGLPVEGISRIIKKSGDVYYLGYWNLAQGKEFVAPNKYVVSGYDTTAAGDLMKWGAGVYKNAGDGRWAVRYDFNGEYAMVNTGKVETVTHKFGTGAYGYPNTYEEAPELGWDVTERLVYAQIIDTNGNEILSGGPYPYLAGARLYPQAGPYMVYQELSTKFMIFRSDQDTTSIFYSHLESGVAGPEGIIIPAQYHGGILPNGLVPADAGMRIIAELSLVITDTSPYERDHYEGDFYKGDLGTGVVDFNNKTMLPFVQFRGVGYDAENNVLVGDYIYRPDGTKMPGTDEHVSGIVNGYVTIGGQTGGSDTRVVKGVISVKTGAAYTHENLKGSSCSNVSVNNTLWVNKGSDKEPKWGLVNLQGEVLLPFEYEEADGFGDSWQRADGAYATVKKNGRRGMVDTMGNELLPCIYRSIGTPVDGYRSIQDYDTDKWGVYSLNSGKVTTPCQFTSINMRFRAQGWGAIMGTVPIQVGNSLNALFDMDTGKQVTPTYLVMKPSERGLFYNTYGKKVDTFEVKVVGSGAGDILETGDYYMQIYGKYLYPVWVSSQHTYYMELSDKKPDKPFTVKLLNYSDDRGPEYSIAYDGTYIMQPSSQDGAQLQSSLISHMWRINKYSSFCTIRDYGNQKLLVNASGEKSDNGTHIIIWPHTGSAPENGKISFIKAN